VFLADLPVAFVRSQWQPVPGPATVITSSRCIRTYLDLMHPTVPPTLNAAFTLVPVEPPAAAAG